MGCVASRIDKVERVQVCKQRKRLMKQLVVFRGDFADAQLAYLKALKNTSVTLRQFTESESLDIENAAEEVFAPPASPPPPLPPSPPPPPPLSPDPRKTEDISQKEEEEEGPGGEAGKEIAQCETPLSPPVANPTWVPWDDPWDHLMSSSQYHWAKDEAEEDEDWAETKTEFEEDEEVVVAREEKVLQSIELPEKPQAAGSVDGGSSTASWHAKDATVLWRSKRKTLEGIAKELDDHFLKASAGAKEIAVLMDLNGSHGFLPQTYKESNGKKGNTAKVFSALSWSWSSKPLQFSRDSVDSTGRLSEPCRPGAHCVTLKKLLEEEHKLYKDVKEEEAAKLEHEKKSSLLQRQDNENHDSTKTEKIRSAVESLEADLMRLQESIAETCSSILNRIDDELYPQMVAITSGLLQMWRTMYESHRAQYQISQLLNHLADNQKMNRSTAYHRQAADQLKTEVNRWYNSFGQVVSSQQDYVRTLCKWIKLTDGLKDDHRQSLHSSAVRSLCEKWLFSLERLPDKAASEAIKGLCSAIHDIVLEQEEEHSLQRKYEKAERRLHRELDSLTEMEMKLEGSASAGAGDGTSGLSPKHPLELKRAKAEALRRHTESEKARYLKSVQATKALTLNSLKTRLPGVFKALTDFSRGSVEAIEAVFGHARPKEEGGNCGGESETPQN